MGSVPQQAAYTRYQDAETVGTKSAIPGGNASVLHPDFVRVMNNYSDPNPDGVDYTPIGEDASYQKKMFYRTAVTTTFHVLWGQFDPPVYGAGNTLLVRLRAHDNGDHEVTLDGFPQPTDRIVFEATETPPVMNNSRSIVFNDGVVQVILKLTTYTEQNVPVWNMQTAINGRVQSNYYLVPFTVANPPVITVD